MITRDDFLDLIHAHTTAVFIEGKDKPEIVLEMKYFDTVIDGILKRFLEKIQNSIKLS